MSNNTLMNSSLLRGAMENPRERLIEIFGLKEGRKLFGADGDGAAPAGFMSRADLLETIPSNRGVTVDGQNLNEIWMEMQAMLAAFNGSNDQLVSLLSFPTAIANEKVGVPSNPGFQRATEYGRPSKVRLTQIARGFPIDHFDIGDGYTQEYIDTATGAQIVAIQATILNAWSSLEREIVLEALFNDTNTTDKDNILVKRLYNGDGEIPPTIKRWTHLGTHTHYLANGGAGFTQANLDTMGTHLVHHGFREYGDAAFILLAHRDDVATIRAMAGFVPAASGEFPSILAGSGVIQGLQRSEGTSNLRVEGWVNDWTVVQFNDMPTGYLLGIVSGGPMDARNIVGRRLHENPSARGLRLIEGNRQNYPLYDSVYDGYVGAGVGQRGAGVIMQDAAAYVVPTFSTGN